MLCAGVGDQSIGGACDLDRHRFLHSDEAMEQHDRRQDESWRFDFCHDILAHTHASKHSDLAGNVVINVACPGCGADYALDEARIPEGGHSMRCPKCENRFSVNKDGSVAAAKKPRMATMVGTPGSPGLPPVPKPTGYKPPAPGATAPKPPPPPPPPSGGAKRKFAKTQMGTLGDIDLPARPADSERNKEAQVKPPKPPIAPAFDENLPASKAKSARGTMMGVPESANLPARKEPAASGAQGASFEDLPAAVKPATVKKAFEKTQLGVAGVSDPGLDALDGISLPPAEPSQSDAEIDPFADFAGPDLSLPPVSSPEGPESDGGVDLPQPKLGDDLPVPGDLADLPAPGGTSGDLPAPTDREQYLPANVGDNLPSPSLDDAFGEIELPDFGIDAGAQPGPKEVGAAKQTAAGFGELGGDFEFEMPSAEQNSAPDFNAGGLDFEPAALDAPSKDAELDLGFAATGIGGTAAGELDLELEPPSGGADTLAYGEVDLGMRDDATGGELDLELDGHEGGGGAPPPAALSMDDEEEEERKQREAEKRAEQEALTKARASANRKRRVLAIGLVATLGVVGLIGVGLQFVPGMGLFGRYQIEKYLPEAGSPAAAKQAIEKAHKLIDQDTYLQAREGLKQLSQSRRSMGLNRELLSRSVIEESLYVARFGDATFGGNERVSLAMQRIEERGGDAPDVDVARAASFLAKSDPGAALEAAKGDSSILGRLVQGEAAFLVGDAKTALSAYQAAAAKHKVPRTQWGLARGLLLAAGVTDAKTVAAVGDVLAASPNHLGARILRAHALEAEGKHEEALVLVREATGQQKTADGKTLVGSQQEQSDAWTAYGLLMAAERNRPETRKAFERALKHDPFNADALIHGGNAMLLDARYGDAYELFQRVLTLPNPRMGLSRPPRDLTTAAELGASRAMIETQRTQEAINKLTELAKKFPEDVEVLMWLGKAYQKSEQPSEAEPRFREAITLAPERFEGYMALAQLFFYIEDPDSAAEVLKQAKDKVEESAAMRRLLGESELARGYLDAAEGEFRRALVLDPKDIGAQFFLGVVLRKRGKLDEAATAFDEIGKRDPKWPGLAVERGKVFEEKGEAPRAVKMYREALEKNPRDLDLRLRLGAAQVSAGNLEDAETNLSVVLKARPDSAEAEHFLGRIALERGNYESASARFKNATDLDPTQFVYFTYLAEAELGRGHITAVGPALKRAEELDPNEPELFLLRGRLGVRTGAVQDAIRDLKKTLQLDPDLIEAYSHMGSAYAQMGDNRSAINAYQQAAAHAPNEGQWYYKLGELFMNTDRRADAMRELKKAVEAGEKLDHDPSWLAESYRLLGDGERLGGNEGAAKKHYLKYLEIAPASAMDRDAVTEQLERWGVDL